MKLRSAFSLLLVIPLTTPLLRADDAPPPQAAPANAPGQPGGEKKTELEMRMDRMGKAFRKLKKQVADPAQNAASLELLATMQAAAKEAEDLTPAKAEDIPPDQRAKFVDDFKKGIKTLEDKFSALQDALTAGKNEDAVKIVADIGSFEKDSHKQFKRPDKD